VLLAPAAVIIGAGAAIVALLRRASRHGPHRAVTRLAQRGRGSAAIARRTHLAQDAVRSVLRARRQGA
jgi:hypothetical protein